MARVTGAAARFAAELRIAAATAGATQRRIAARAGVAQSLVSRVSTGIVVPDLAVADALATAVGHALSITLVPSRGLRLRDSGQLRLADTIRSQAHRRWRVQLELPIGQPPDLRAADLVLEQPAELLHIEIERWLRDFQAQVRRAQLKRLALAERFERPVRLVLAVRDSATTRRIVAEHAGLIRTAFPVSPRRTWAAIRTGELLGADALIWVRPLAPAPDARRASESPRDAHHVSGDAGLSSTIG
jgi:transcriptional regulator with XRE-family HTH domain